MTTLSDLADYVMEHTRRAPSDAKGEPIVDVHFFKCLVGESFDPAEFNKRILAALNGPGEFQDISPDRAAQGPSYIEWGAWIGSQDVALRLLACGQIAGMWTVITPATLHVTGAAADQLAGGGFVMNEGMKAVTA